MFVFRGIAGFGLVGFAASHIFNAKVVFFRQSCVIGLLLAKISDKIVN